MKPITIALSLIFPVVIVLLFSAFLPSMLAVLAAALCMNATIKIPSVRDYVRSGTVSLFLFALVFAISSYIIRRDKLADPYGMLLLFFILAAGPVACVYAARLVGHAISFRFRKSATK